jgi:hypothetical protein
LKVLAPALAVIGAVVLVLLAASFGDQAPAGRDEGSSLAITAPSPSASAAPSATPKPLPTPPSGPRLVLEDGFEDGFSPRWQITEDGDASVTLVTGEARVGSANARLQVSQDEESRANLDLRLPIATTGVSLEGWFRVVGEGVVDSNVPIFRLFRNDARIVDVYRQNRAGQLWVRSTDAQGKATYHRASRVLKLGRWYRVRVTATAADTASVVSVRVGRTTVFNDVIPLVGWSYTDAMIGAEHVAQQMILDVDDVSIRVVSSRAGR